MINARGIIKILKQTEKEWQNNPASAPLVTQQAERVLAYVVDELSVFIEKELDKVERAQRRKKKS